MKEINFEDYENAITHFLMSKGLSKGQVFWVHGFTALELAEYIEKYVKEVRS